MDEIYEYFEEYWEEKEEYWNERFKEEKLKND